MFKLLLFLYVESLCTSSSSDRSLQIQHSQDRQIVELQLYANNRDV